MHFFSRLLSFIICLQLAVGCETYVASTSIVENPAASVPQGFIRLQGVISKLMRASGEIFLSSAMAAEGELQVFDMSFDENNPGAGPALIHSETISGSDQFIIDLPEEKIASGVIKIQFKSVDNDPLKNRQFLTTAQTLMKAEMTSNESIKAEIISRQLENELNNNTIAVADIPSQFALHDKKFNLDTEISRFGNIEAAVKLLANPGTRETMINIMFNARLEVEENSSTVLKSQMKFYDIANLNGYMNDDFIMNCQHLGATVFFSESRPFTVEVQAVEAALIEKTGQNWNDQKQSFTQFNQANSLIFDVTSKLNQIERDKQEAFSVKISLKSLDPQKPFPVNECRIFSEGYDKLFYDSLAENDPSLDFQFNSNFITSISPSSLGSLSAAKLVYSDAVKNALEDLKSRLQTLNFSPEAEASILNFQLQRAQKLMDEKLVLVENHLKAASPTFDQYYLLSVATTNTKDVPEAYSLLMSNYDKTISVFKNLILVDKKIPPAEALPFYKSQTAAASLLMSERMIVFFDHYQKLSNPALSLYHGELQEIRAIKPEDYSSITEFNLAVLAKHNQQLNLMNQKLIEDGLNPSEKDKALMEDRLLRVAKLKNHEGLVYFKFLFTVP